ncbi:hypothetical protein [Pseudomonas sp. CFBP 13727]|uniref:hypothetical protein n=1 Tax=Pseudomonas sp. CFBP 13727 TaxID=2775295 RepID=UPI0017802BE5|nr:hypothetical protein [Pseudomonas sp. CFBP 13727]MBD8621708.1 hypothetical protein [Pseudomonas sp. CFBP 13727]
MSNAWEVASAIGTLGAVIVALGIPVVSAWKGKQVHRQKADLIASRLIEPVKALEEGLRSEMVSYTFYNDAEHSSDQSHAARIVRIGSLANSINVDVLQDLFILPNGCAGRLAIALGIIDVLTRDVEVVMSQGKWPKLIEMQRLFLVSQWREQASNCADYLAVVRRELQKAADRIAKMPSPEEIYDNNHKYQ